MRLFAREARVPSDAVAAAGLGRGDKVLAHAQDGPRWLLGTRREFVVVECIPGQSSRLVIRLPWESIQSADWSQDAETLTVTEVGEFDRPRAAYLFKLEDPALLLQLVRERVTASVVLQRGQLVADKRGFKVIGRRSPEGGPISWMHEYDPGIDPTDPAVVAAAEAVLRQAREDVGEQSEPI